MKVITCIPLSKQRGLDNLSYFSEQDLAIGTICDIPVRKQKIKAIVSSVVDIKDYKTKVKTNSYNLRPLPKTDAQIVLPTEIITAAEQTASFYPATLPVLLRSWLEKIDIFAAELSPTVNESTLSKKPTGSTHVWQTKYDELITLVKRLNQNKQDKIAIIVSDSNQLAAIKAVLAEFDVGTITGKSSPKQLVKQLQKRIIIASQSFGVVSSLYFEQVIIINPGGESWRNKRWPYFHWDYATKTVRDNMNKDLYIWSSLLDVENWQTASSQSNKSNHYIIDRYPKSNKARLVKRGSGQKKLTDIVFDTRSQKLIIDCVQNKAKCQVYVTRRGLYPVLVCQDCSHTTYTKKFEEQIKKYRIAGSVSEWVDPNIAEEWVDRCDNCGGWRLHPIAISLEQTRQALSELIGDESTIVAIDTVTETHAQSQKKVKDFFKDENKSILLTTQRGAYNVTQPVDFSIITSVDAALTSNSLNVETDILRLLWHVEQMTNKLLILQTRIDDNRVINTYLSGAIRQLQYKNLKERKALKFPPNYVQIKIASRNISSLPHFGVVKKLVTETIGGQFAVLPGLRQEQILLMTIDIDSWTDQISDPLKNYLINISTEYKVIINPDIIL